MRKALVGALALGWSSRGSAPRRPAAAAAAAVASWSERQTVPGLTERTIWGRDQVYVYRLPANVTHTGNLHVELTYTPADGDCFVYLLGPVAKGSQEWQVCPGTYGQGFLSLWPGREVVDYAVPAVLDQDARRRRRARRRVLRGRAGGQRGVALQPDGLSAARRRRAARTRRPRPRSRGACFRAPAAAGAALKVAGSAVRRRVRPDADVAGSGRVPPAVPGGRAPGARSTPASPAPAGELRAVRLSAALGPGGRRRPGEPAAPDSSHWDLYDAQPARGGAAGGRRLVRPAGRLRRAGRGLVDPARRRITTCRSSGSPPRSPTPPRRRSPGRRPPACGRSATRRRC